MPPSLALDPPLVPPTPPGGIVASAGEAPDEPEAYKPPFRTSLKLTPAQEDKLLQDTLKRITELRREVGLTETNDIPAPLGRETASWMYQRKCWDDNYQGDVRYRIALGGIFPKSNYTLGDITRHVRYMAATAQAALLGTFPFFTWVGSNPLKELQARQVDQYCQGEVKRSTVRSALRQAQKIALYRGECVVRTSYVSDSSHYIGEATVLVDKATAQYTDQGKLVPGTGTPILTPNKRLYAYLDDDAIPSPAVGGLLLLKNDPSFVYHIDSATGAIIVPPNQDTDDDADKTERSGVYNKFLDLPQIAMKYEGVTCEPLHYSAFVCPLNAPSIEAADTCFELYQESVNALNKRWGGVNISAPYFNWHAQPGQDKPIYAQGETDHAPSAIYKRVSMARVFRRCDPQETGEDIDVHMEIDVVNKKFVYYTFEQTHFPMGRPYDALPGVEQHPDRWWGRGVPKLLEHQVLFGDSAFNRANFQNSNAASVTFAYQEAVPGWLNKVQPTLGDGRINWVSNNWNADGRKVIWKESLAEPQSKENVGMMQLMGNKADALVGSVSTSSAGQADLNQSHTATTDQLIQQNSDVIARATHIGQAEVLEKIMGKVVHFVLINMDTAQLMFMEGTNELVTINAREAQNLNREMSIMITQGKATLLLANSKELIEIGERYSDLLDTNPAKAKRVRSAYIIHAKALDDSETETRFPDVTQKMIDDFAAAQAANQPQIPPSRSISTKYSELARSEQVQVLAAEQIQAAPDAEIEADKAEAAAKEAAEIEAKKPEPTEKPATKES